MGGVSTLYFFKAKKQILVTKKQQKQTKANKKTKINKQLLKFCNLCFFYSVFHRDFCLKKRKYAHTPNYYTTEMVKQQHCFFLIIFTCEGRSYSFKVWVMLQYILFHNSAFIPKK